jgi:hypothetical protein
VLRLQNEEILQHFDDAIAVLRDGRPLLVALKQPPPGPYALFHHLAHAHERTRDVRRLFVRLLDSSAAYLDALAEAPEEAEEIRRDLKIDYEGIFHFGSVLLDQFASACGYLAGLPESDAINHPFNWLAVRVEQEAIPSALRPIRERLLRHTRWLHFWMRTYRNRFVVHTNHPVQISTVTRGEDFCLFTPTAVGWNDDEATAAEMRALLPHAPDWLRQADPNYWERARPAALFQRVIENIGRIDDQATRGAVANLAKRAGLQTPSFHVVASVLSKFMSDGTQGVRDAALKAPDEINIGRAPRHSSAQQAPHE